MRAGEVRVDVLGRFRVRCCHADRTPSPGLPSTLVKLLALRRSVVVDEAVDLLWPGTDAVTGRSRLRNLRNRLAAATGPLVVRDGDTLALAGTTTVDLHEFESAALAALAAVPPERTERARQALAWCGGDLLPGDPYADWAAAPRERVRRRRVALLDAVADDAVARGATDEAILLLEEAIDLEPLDESRTVLAMRLLLDRGHRAGALALGRRAAATAADLGLPVGAELRAMLTPPLPD